MERAVNQPVKAAAPILTTNLGRKILAENSKWNLASVPSLTSLCIKILVLNFEKCPISEGLPVKYREQILASISTTIPLPIVAPLIEDEGYWKRRAQSVFKLCDPEQHDDSWKQLFFEMHIQALLEARYPKKDESAEELLELEKELILASPCVRKMHLRQLKPMYDADKVKLAPDAKGVELGDIVHDPTQLNPDHLNPIILFKNLKNLRELSLFYGVNDAGTAFHRAFFGMTLHDSIQLSECLRQPNILQRLSIRSSGIDDDRCLLISDALLENECLQFLDLSHNYIGNKGVRGLAKLLNRPNCMISTLILHNNAIGQEGVVSIGKAIIHNNVLKVLDLGLNNIQDAGGVELMELLERNDALEEISLSGNCLGAEFVIALCSLLQRNGAALKRFDISCNKLGSPTSAQVIHDLSAFASTIGKGAPTVTDEPGSILFDAINRNKYVTNFDVRLTGISAEYTAAIQSIINENSA